MQYILSSKSGIKTARNLAELLSIKAFINPRKTPPVIRWGSQLGNYAEDTKYNDPKLLNIASNKVNFSEFSKENNIPAILYKREVPQIYPVVIRTLLTSCAGKGIILAKDEAEYLPYKNFYYSDFEYFDSEYRVHVLGGEVVKIFKKIFVGEEEAKFPIRNLEKGYHFSLLNLEGHVKLKEIIHIVYEKLPLQMMGVDLGHLNTGGYKIIEINTCPSLNDETLKLYADFLKEIL